MSDTLIGYLDTGMTRDFADGYRLGDARGYDRGRADEARDAAAFDAASWRPVRDFVLASTRRADRAELEVRRAMPPTGCPPLCGRCSSCAAFDAWQRRGGRPFLGVRREAELASAGAA